ncbi:hypothetical protein BKA64DRAFT_684721 [Cadophora sp. MPI-SDFR-AT-0126]|nr:hypothetical protein BKA64DRAFT_684721 [Leotiomycetes sp. MPI-SDFR-AT-0126]
MPPRSLLSRFKGKVSRAFSRERGSSSPTRTSTDSGSRPPGGNPATALSASQSLDDGVPVIPDPQPSPAALSAPAPAGNPSADQALVLAQQAQPVALPERNLWLVAREMLSQDLQEQLAFAEEKSQDAVTLTANENTNVQQVSGIDAIILRAQKLIDIEEQKRYKTLGAKLLGSTETFKQLVDAGLEYDPTGYGKTAWGVVSFGLTWAINVKDMREFVFENSDYLARLLARYFVYENMYRAGTYAGSSMRGRLEDAIADVYYAVYTYVISMMRYLDNNSWVHAFQGIVPVEDREISDLKTKIENKDKIVSDLLIEVRSEARGKEYNALKAGLDKIGLQFSAMIQPLEYWTLRFDQRLDNLEKTYGETRPQRRLIDQSHGHKFVVPRWQRRDFAGREDIVAQIQDLSRHNAQSTVLVALTGMGGIGKSEIALEYAHAQRTSCSVFWVNAQTSETLQESFVNIAGELASREQKANVAIRLVRNWCEENSKSWVMIFDNAIDWNTVKPYIFPGSSRQILFTTRNQAFAPFEAGVQKIKVPPLAETDSLVLLLAGLSGSTESQTMLLDDIRSYVVQNIDCGPHSETSFKETTIGAFLIDKLAVEDFASLRTFSNEYLGHLPLAIVQFTAYISSAKISLREYIKKFEIQKRMILKWKLDSAEYNESVMTTWELSYNLIDNNFSTDLLKFLAFLNPQGISIGLLKDTFKPVRWWHGLMSGSLIQAHDAGLEFLETDHEDYDFDSSLAKLESLSLVERISPTTGVAPVICMHALVHEWIQLRMSEQDRMIWIERSMMVLYSSLPPLIQSKQDLETELRSERVLTHGSVALRNARVYIQKRKSESPVPKTFIMLFLEIYLWYRGSEYLVMARQLADLNTAANSPVTPMLAAASLLDMFDVYITSEIQSSPESSKVIGNVNALDSVSLSASDHRTWVTYAVLANRLTSDIKGAWHSAFIEWDQDVRITLTQTVAPPQLEKFCTSEISYAENCNDSTDIATICQAYVNSPWMRQIDWEKSKDRHDFVAQVPIATTALEHGLIEFDKFFLEYLRASAGKEKHDIIFHILDHPKLSIPLLSKGLLYHSSGVPLPSLWQALQQRPRICQNVVYGLQGNSPGSVALYDQAYPWIRSLFRCCEIGDITTIPNESGVDLSCRNLYQQHFLSCWQHYGISNLRTQEWAWELAIYYRKEEEFFKRLLLWESIAEKCEKLGKRDPFTKKWYSSFWDGPSGVDSIREQWWHYVQTWGGLEGQKLKGLEDMGYSETATVRDEMLQRYVVHFREILGAQNEWSLFWAEKALGLSLEI